MADYNTTDLFRFGTYRALIHKNSTSGYAMGQFTDDEITDTTPAATIVSEALVMESIVSVGSAGANRITVQRFGGQEFEGRFDIGAGEFTDAQIAFSDASPSLEWVSNGSKVNTSAISGVTIGGQNERPENLNDLGGIFTIGSASINRSTGATALEYLHFFQPSFSLARTSEEFAGIQSSTTDPYNAVYNMAAQNSLQIQNGVLLSALNIGYTKGYRHMFRSSYKNYALVTAIMKSGDTSFTLPRLPLSSSATATGDNWIVKNGTATAVSSINTTTGVVTLSGAASDYDIWVIWYPLADQS